MSHHVSGRASARTQVFLAEVCFYSGMWLKLTFYFETEFKIKFILDMQMYWIKWHISKYLLPISATPIADYTKFRINVLSYERVCAVSSYYESFGRYVSMTMLQLITQSLLWVF